jgi:hypothetical protein
MLFTKAVSSKARTLALCEIISQKRSNFGPATKATIPTFSLVWKGGG